jgi:hypothetical protein
MNYWTENELQQLRNNIIPEGRTISSCYKKAWTLKIHFNPSGIDTSRKNLTEEQKNKIVQYVKKCRNARETGRIFGVSYEYVRKLARENGVLINPSSRDLLQDHFIYKGEKYTYKKGRWRSTSGIRKNLIHEIWKEKNPGETIKNDEYIIFKDGNHFNIKLSNLVKVNRSEYMKRRMSNPEFYVLAYSALMFGRLNRKIKASLDPEFEKNIAKKTWETRRRRKS